MHTPIRSSPRRRAGVNRTTTTLRAPGHDAERETLRPRPRTRARPARSIGWPAETPPPGWLENPRRPLDTDGKRRVHWSALANRPPSNGRRRTRRRTPKSQTPVAFRSSCIAGRGRTLRATRSVRPLGEFAGAAREAPLNFAREAAAKGHHAHHEDATDDHRNPGAHQVGEALLQPDHDSCAHHRTAKDPAAPAPEHLHQ